MNGFDAAIILILIMGAVVGFKRGFTYEVVSTVGFFLVLILAYFLKNPLSVFLYEHLPFFKFGGIFKGVTVLNIFLSFLHLLNLRKPLKCDYIALQAVYYF